MPLKDLTVLLLLTSVFLVSFAYLCNQDYQDELKEEQVYKEMVCKGYWPDYQDLKPYCQGLLK